MNVNFIEFSRYSLSSFEKNFLSSLSALQKKIVVVVSFAFASLAALYMARKWIFSVKVECEDKGVNKDKETKDLLDKSESTKIEIKEFSDEKTTKSELESERKKLDDEKMLFLNEIACTVITEELIQSLEVPRNKQVLQQWLGYTVRDALKMHSKAIVPKKVPII